MAEIRRGNEPPFKKTFDGDPSVSILGPDLTAHATSMARPVDGAREEIASGYYRVFVWGQAQYMSMGEPRTFTFRAWDGVELNGDADIEEDWGGWVMVPHPMGYEST